MLKNFWYACAFSEHVRREPMRITVLGQQLVLYRTAADEVICLSDLCVHRGGALSDGHLEGDCLVCPYHGWRYQPDGACNRIPANQLGVTVPRKARVDAYPTRERYGLVWAFLGDLPEAERPPLPVLDDFAAPGLRAIHGDYRWRAHYTRVIENGMDAAHAPFVHGGAFGNPEEPEVADYKVELGEWSSRAAITLKPAAARGRGPWSKLYRREPQPVRTLVAFHLPNVVRLEVGLPIGRFILITFHLPVDDATTISKWVLLRDFFTQPWMDRGARQRVFKIFDQDRAVVEAQRPELLPYDLSAELHVRSDAMQIAYRKLRRRMLERGWGIDTHRIQAELGRYQAVVIPSPARREIPELAQAWVLKEVPVREPAPDRERALGQANHEAHG
jgi:phenylpropionate dioxygenase-like ring-hydroxylating dioxygenase large terminal subunit